MPEPKKPAKLIKRKHHYKLMLVEMLENKGYNFEGDRANNSVSLLNSIHRKNFPNSLEFDKIDVGRVESRNAVAGELLFLNTFVNNTETQKPLVITIEFLTRSNVSFLQKIVMSLYGHMTFLGKTDLEVQELVKNNIRPQQITRTSYIGLVSFSEEIYDYFLVLSKSKLAHRSWNSTFKKFVKDPPAPMKNFLQNFKKSSLWIKTEIAKIGGHRTRVPLNDEVFLPDEPQQDLSVTIELPELEHSFHENHFIEVEREIISPIFFEKEVDHLGLPNPPAVVDFLPAPNNIIPIVNANNLAVPVNEMAKLSLSPSHRPKTNSLPLTKEATHHNRPKRQLVKKQPISFEHDEPSLAKRDSNPLIHPHSSNNSKRVKNALMVPPVYREDETLIQRSFKSSNPNRNLF